MSVEATRGIRLALIALALVIAIVGAQALADFSAPPEATVSTGASLGQTGFEYLGGLRKFAAAALWNRLEPQFHEYGNGESIAKRLEFLPTMRLVQLLDPQFEQSYYVSAYMLARLGRLDQGLQIAEEGVANNPKSGLMRANLAQVLLMQDKEKKLPEMLVQTKIGLGPDMTWSSTDDQFEGYGIFRTVLRLAGDDAAAERVNAIQQGLGAQGAGLGIERDE